jgi:hypothetical protein
MLIQFYASNELAAESISEWCRSFALTNIHQSLPLILYLLAVSGWSTSLEVLFGRPQAKLAP